MSGTDDSTANTPESPSDYEVGYGKPPRRTRFEPGRSGNPRGRPKGTKNLKTDLSEELAEKILVREGATSRSVSKQRAFVKALLSKSLKGEARPASLLTMMIMRLLDTGEGESEVASPLHDDERAILEAFEQRVRRSSGGVDEAHVRPDAESRPGVDQ